MPRKSAFCKRWTPLPARLGPEVAQVSVSLASDWQSIEIIRGDGRIYRDVRPLGALWRVHCVGAAAAFRARAAMGWAGVAILPPI